MKLKSGLNVVSAFFWTFWATLSLAGLPTSEGRLYSEEQIEGRAITIRTAYRVARNTTRDILGGS